MNGSKTLHAASAATGILGRLPADLTWLNSALGAKLHFVPLPVKRNLCGCHHCFSHSSQHGCLGLSEAVSFQTAGRYLEWCAPVSKLRCSFLRAQRYLYTPLARKDSIPDLQRFLRDIGTDPKEARFWLKLFLNINQRNPFAVVEIAPEVFAASSHLEHLASAVSFLQRNSLRPVLVFGDARSEQSGQQKTLQDLKADSIEKSCALSNTLHDQGLESCVLFAGSNIIQVEDISTRDEHRVKQVNPRLIEWCLTRQAIPVIPAFGETESGQIVHLSAWDITSAVARQLQPLKVIKVNCCGGFRDERGQIIANINLPFDFQAAKEKRWCSEDVVQTIEEVSSLLTGLPEHTSVVITSADRVLQELFTHHGSGTFLKMTERILKYDSLEKVDIEKLRNLLTKSFKKSLSDTYFEDVKHLVHTVYVSERYTAAAVILRFDGCDIPYLCKFAVSVQAQGEGTGDILWEVIQRDFSQLFWRSRGSNPVNPWYFRKSEGSWTNRKWTVFWYGIQEPVLSNDLIKKAVSAPESFCLSTPSAAAK